MAATNSLPDHARRTLTTIALVALALFLWKIAPVLMLGFAGIVVASAIRAASDPLATRLNVSPTLSVGFVFAVFLALLAAGGFGFGVQISQQTSELWDAVRQAGSAVSERLEDSPVGSWVLESLGGTTDPEAMSKALKGTLSVFGAVTDVLLVLFVALYVAVDPRTYRNGFLLLLPQGARAQVGDALDAAGDALRKWLVGQLGAMVAVGVFTALGLWAVGVPMALALGVLSGLLDFVPVVGPLIAAIPGIMVAFAQGPEVAMYAALVYLTVQFVEGNVILPLAQKWAVHLPPVLGLLSIVAFGLVFGLIGVLFAVPLTVVFYVLVQRLWVSRLK